MSSAFDFRLYSFVAGLYLSPIQCGIQTAHVVGNISRRTDAYGFSPCRDYATWAELDKTIIVLNATNHQGVTDCWAELKRTGVDPGFVVGDVFHEDEASMNGMATACGVIVPRRYWDVTLERAAEFGGVEDRWVHGMQPDGMVMVYPVSCPEGQFISHIKKYRMV